ncbi:Hypothetical protein D9617_7g032400 [Elsinoe fawcettii]|nr:Hypothetical protein D9617_7g032400 [Elsinoe fawcettii]
MTPPAIEINVNNDNGSGDEEKSRAAFWQIEFAKDKLYDQRRDLFLNLAAHPDA